MPTMLDRASRIRREVVLTAVLVIVDLLAVAVEVVSVEVVSVLAVVLVVFMTGLRGVL